MATPAIALLRAALPNAEIHALCRPFLLDLLQTNPHLTRIIAADDRKLPTETRLLLKSQRYDVALMFTNSPRPAWLAWRLGARVRVGFARGGQSLLLSHRIPFDPLEWQTPVEKPLTPKSITGTPKPGKPRHMVMYYLKVVEEALRAIAPEVNMASVATDYKLVLPVAPESRRRIDALLRERGLMGKRLIGLNPGAAHGPAKRWPPDRLGRAADAMARNDWAFISTASRQEKELTDQVAAAMSVELHRLGEHASLADLPALIETLDVLITNDSGPMHIAAAVNTPALAIFGPTDWPSTRPWNSPAARAFVDVPCSPCFARDCPIDHPCMQSLDSYEVATQALELLNQTGKWMHI